MSKEYFIFYFCGGEGGERIRVFYCIICNFRWISVKISAVTLKSECDYPQIRHAKSYYNTVESISRGVRSRLSALAFIMTLAQLLHPRSFLGTQGQVEQSLALVDL